MSERATATSTSTTQLLHRSLIALAVLGIIGPAIELAMLRHWQSAVQLIPWVALAALTVAVLLMRNPTTRGLMAVRAIALAVALVTLFGVFEHVSANYEAGPLDFRYANRWSAMSLPARLWAAASKSVGPAPALAPAVLIQIALCLVFATIRHPALKAQSDQPWPEEEEHIPASSDLS